jgi:excinuclease ABC subunit A
MTVDAAWEFFEDEPNVGAEHLQCCAKSVSAISGSVSQLLSYPAGEAQRIKLATELQRMQRGDTLYVLDEPTTGLHPSDVDKLMRQLDGLVESGNTVIVVEHEMRVVAGSDWVIDIGPGAGDEGGTIVAQGTPQELARLAASKPGKSKTAPYLAKFLGGS